MTLRTSTPAQEGVYQASKYLKFQVLCDADELSELFAKWPSFWIYPLTGVCSGEPISQNTFLSAYRDWINTLKQGVAPSDAELKKVLAAAFTAEPDALWKQQVGEGRYLIKMARPLIHVQAHFFTYSALDGVFRPMTMGPKNIFWGLQFSFPQIYQDPKTMELKEVEESPNSEMFQILKQWVRDFTRATPFVVEDKKTNVPIRLGKNCFAWIENHPQLKEQKIHVHV